MRAGAELSALLPLRVLTMIGAGRVHAASRGCVGFMAPPAQRGRAITFIFLGWSIASVLGMPIGAWIGES